MRTNRLILRRALPLDSDRAELCSFIAIFVSAMRNSDGTAVASGTGYLSFGCVRMRDEIELVDV